jgi:periplasmic divalent cation tolerance protein
MSDVLVVSVTAAGAEEAMRLGEAAVEARLAACANVVAPIRSIYRWKGAVHRDAEHLLLLKTTRRRLDALVALILSRHTYENPEILAVAAAGGSEAYLRWVVEETAPSEEP